ncbi:DUF3891 family protein [Paenibacillus alkalitolerans]|uniref:DUF3891 family protein n=1 Tax=Paenibacillus alkalitolerans TaxID=2799335 RepID=UPI0018F6E53E|nr:DUF3891 family protein [Paenibacillus alkalitolerans]
MIVRETERAFIMITQHDHANLSGQLASMFRTTLLADDKFKDDVLLAIYEHDRGHIRLDDTPIWNDRINAPFSFMDYPLLPKLTHYKLGLDEVEAQSPYAGLLCSLHFSSFFLDSGQADCIEFVQTETERQEKIAEALKLDDRKLIDQHFRLLQLCDDLSLYVCLNEPGVSKEREHPWYRGGFARSELFNEQGHKPLMAIWRNEKEIALNPSPLEHDVVTALRLKKVEKSLIRQKGIEQAYKETEWTVQETAFCASEE